ncbi:class E sortase [Pseudonocardia nigra]|uniref:class E sortase n=1 Tax=Pseudonocardia nigra TaxID=1921578 RepID=UPI001C5F4745|nr:class E sortase [Pseudonocardia nigra]
MRAVHRVSRWLGATCLTALVAAGLMIVPGMVATPSEPDGVAELVEQRAREAPSWDLVLRLRDELAASAADNPDYPIDPAQAALVATSPQEYTPLGRISSEAIGLDAVYAAGVHPSVLERGPGLWPGTATPGQPGNAVISGHRTTHTRPFGDLDELVAGDPVVVTAEGGSGVTYRVTETAIVPEAEYTAFVLARPADAEARQLTLFACHPKGDRTHRIVVRATAEAGEGR